MGLSLQSPWRSLGCLTSMEMMKLSWSSSPKIIKCWLVTPSLSCRWAHADLEPDNYRVITWVYRSARELNSTKTVQFRRNKSNPIQPISIRLNNYNQFKTWKRWFYILVQSFMYKHKPILFNISQYSLTKKKSVNHAWNTSTPKQIGPSHA